MEPLLGDDVTKQMDTQSFDLRCDVGERNEICLNGFKKSDVSVIIFVMNLRGSSKNKWGQNKILRLNVDFRVTSAGYVGLESIRSKH